MKQGWNSIDPIVRLLFVGTFITIGIMVLSDKVLKEDAQVFQVLAGLVGNFSGALMVKIKANQPDEHPPGSSEIKKITTSSIEVTPAAEEKKAEQ